MDSFPEDLKLLEDNLYSITLMIDENNVINKSSEFKSVNIFKGIEICEECPTQTTGLTSGSLVEDVSF